MLEVGSRENDTFATIDRQAIDAIKRKTFILQDYDAADLRDFEETIMKGRIYFLEQIQLYCHLWFGHN